MRRPCRPGDTSSVECSTGGPRTASADRPSDVTYDPRVPTFSARFLGCKVSYTDLQAIRERLLADGHRDVDDGADVALVNTCCVTHEAVSKSRKEVARAARTHRRVYVTGCAPKPPNQGVAGP